MAYFLTRCLSYPVIFPTWKLTIYDREVGTSVRHRMITCSGMQFRPFFFRLVFDLVMFGRNALLEHLFGGSRV